MIKTVGERLERAKRPLFLNHFSADGDSLGSNLALYLRAKTAGQDPAIFAPEEKNPKYSFLPSFDAIRVSAGDIDLSRHDLIVCADVADAKLTGFEEALASRRDDIVVIDHHASAEEYGSDNYLDPSASSTAEMLFRLFRERKWEITKEIATCLLTGIVSDTGVLRFQSTSPATVRATADLMEAGGEYHTVIYLMYENLPFAAMQLWGRALRSTTFDPKTRFATAVITRKDLQETGAVSVEGFANFFSQLSEARATALFIENDGGVKCSLRGRADDVDVSLIAKQFGGGGHKRAGGFFSNESLPVMLARWKTLLESGIL